MSGNKPKLGLSVMPTEDFQTATHELFQKNLVEVLEWSFDFPLNGVVVDEWCEDLLNEYAERDALTGHGVNLSPLSARFSERQKMWLEYARKEFKTRNYVHASEHFGYSEAGPIKHGAPLSVPLNEVSLRLGQEMMKRYSDATQRPVGLENLAFAFCLDEVKKQGEFINQLLAPVDGFLLLDLHNTYCQIENFGVSELELLKSYPLSKVRELHISGGSWSASVSGKRHKVRRDTHDDAVPQEVFNLATLAIKLCPNIEFVILERLANTMMDTESQQEFREDFETMGEILEVCYA